MTDNKFERDKEDEHGMLYECFPEMVISKLSTQCDFETRDYFYQLDTKNFYFSWVKSSSLHRLELFGVQQP